MAKSGLLDYLDNCENLSKKLKLEACTSAGPNNDTVKCTDILKCLRPAADDESENPCCHMTPPSPLFLPRTRLRSVLQNKSNLPQDKVSTSKAPSKHVSEKKAVVKVTEKSSPATMTELITKVPCVEKHFNVKRMIGWGTFSTVFLASEKRTDVEGPEQHYALKHICSSSTNSKQVMFEIKCLKEIGGCENVVGLKSILRSGPEHVLVMPYYKQDRFSMLIQEMTFEEVREYIKRLLIALCRVHKFNVIHRDVKPSNFLYERKRKRAALVDFGLAHSAGYYKPSRTRTASRSVVRTRTQSASLVEHAVAKPLQHMKRLASVNGKGSPLHTRSSSMVAMAKSLHQLSRASRKRSAEGEPAPAKEEIKIESGGKRICLANGSKTEPQFVGTPRPQYCRRPGLVSTRLPTYVPLPTTPSPVGNSTGSDRLFTSMSPASPASSNASPRPSGRTIADLVPNILMNKGGRVNRNRAWGTPARPTGNENTKEVCPKCSKNTKPTAPRAGTAGFRAPEVLIHCPHQTTAIDVWCAGVMFLSMLTGRYPFFKPTNDMESLVQMIAVFGTEKLKKLARSCGKKLTAPYFCPGYKLEKVVETFRNASQQQRPELPKSVTATKNSHSPLPSYTSNNTSMFSKSKAPAQLLTPPYKLEEVPASAYDLLKGLLDINPLTRLSAREALEHPFFSESK